jgi:hypothetical protein
MTNLTRRLGWRLNKVAMGLEHILVLVAQVSHRFAAARWLLCTVRHAVTFGVPLCMFGVSGFVHTCVVGVYSALECTPFWLLWLQELQRKQRVWIVLQDLSVLGVCAVHLPAHMPSAYVLCPPCPFVGWVQLLRAACVRILQRIAEQLARECVDTGSAIV